MFHFVDYDGPAQAALFGVIQHAAGAVRDADIGINHDSHGFNGGKRAQGGATEIGVAGGVDQIEMDLLAGAGQVVGTGDGGIQ